MRTIAAALIIGVFSLSLTPAALAQPQTQMDRINKWFDKNSEDEKRRSDYWNTVRTKPIQKPGDFQKPGDIQVPRGLAAIKTVKADCKQRFTVCADTLFEFDKATLSPDAVVTLKLLLPMIQKLGAHPITVEGHTDAIGTDEYNDNLSMRRAERVKNWLIENRLAPPHAVTSEGKGEKYPVAANTKPDGKDNPAGRALNRRVEIVVNTCKQLEDTQQVEATEQSRREAAAEPVGQRQEPSSETTK